MIVENLLDWAAAVLQETDSALATEVLTQRLSHQFHGAVDKLEVLLSLDKRFVRNADGSWHLSPARVSEKISSDVVDQALALCEQASGYTLERHLDGESPIIISLFRRLSEGILELSEEVEELPRKTYVAYRTVRNFCAIVVRVSKVWVYINIAYSQLRDPQGVAEDCSTIGHLATGDTRFAIRSHDEVEYAMLLIQQAYERSR